MITQCSCFVFIEIMSNQNICLKKSQKQSRKNRSKRKNKEKIKGQDTALEKNPSNEPKKNKKENWWEGRDAVRLRRNRKEKPTERKPRKHFSYSRYLKQQKKLNLIYRFGVKLFCYFVPTNSCNYNFCLTWSNIKCSSSGFHWTHHGHVIFLFYTSLSVCLFSELILPLPNFDCYKIWFLSSIFFLECFHFLVPF